jgi:lipoyl(octanoyl) transferase
MRWTLLVDPAGSPGWKNMAMDQALLDLAAGEGRAFLRLYRWEPAALSFGRNEPALRRYDRAAIERRGLSTVRRPTGGRAVWHAEELTYAVAAPADTFGTLPEAYRRIHETLAVALRSLGVPATLASPTARGSALDAGACFASPAGGEVMVGGRKLVGSAQLRERGALLQHGSILLAGSQAAVADVTAGSPPIDQSTTLAAVTGAPAPFAIVSAAVAAAARGWPGTWDEEPSDSPSLAAVAALHAAHFRSDAWTWRR